MGTNIGIIGLAASGRTTFFRALTGGEVARQKTAESLSSHPGVARVPDPRLTVLENLLHPRTVVSAAVTFIDIGASVRDIIGGKGIVGQLLPQLSQVDALINIVRAFRDDSIPHPAGSVDIERDIASMNLELTFSDVALLERRLERIEVSLKGARPPERPVLLRERELIARIKTNLEKDVPVREMALTPDETRILSGYQSLSAKPLLVVVNIGEDQLPQAEALEAGLKARYSRARSHVITVCGKLEMELSQLDENAAAELRAAYGIRESGVNRIIRASCELLGLITFFTTASSEVRAWLIPAGTDAHRAAGVIHSDMERGFIRAEVISHNDLAKCGSFAEARRRGMLRLEGRSYAVQDGDVITFLFNV